MIISIVLLLYDIFSWNQPALYKKYYHCRARMGVSWRKMSKLLDDFYFRWLKIYHYEVMLNHSKCNESKAGIFHEARRAAREGSWNGHAWKSSASLVEKKLWAWRTSARSRVRILVSLKLYAYAEINCSSVFFPKKLWSSKSYVWMMLWYSGTHFQLVSCSRLTYQGPKTTSFNGSIRDRSCSQSYLKP